MPVAFGQATNASRSIGDSRAAADPSFIIGWLNHAADQADAGDSAGSAKAFAEALRGRKLMGNTDPQVESRLKEVEQKLLAKGLTPQQIIDASRTLGDINNLQHAPTFVKSGPSPLDRRDQVAALTQAASTALQRGDRVKAQELITRAEQLAVPEQWMLPGQVTLSQVKAQLSGATTASGTGVITTGGTTAANNVALGVFQPGRDTTSTQPASGQIELASGQAGDNVGGDELYRRGLELLSQGNREAAYETFIRAWRYQGEMDPALRNQLKDKLAAMQAAGGAEQVPTPMSQITEAELALRQRMMSEVTGEIAAAEANRELEPELVAERLQTLRTRVSQAQLDGEARKRLLTIVDRAITSHQIYMTQNKAAIDQNMRNRQIIEQIALDQEERYKIDAQIASLVETYNDLMDKGEFMQAETVAKQVGALDRNSTIASLLITSARNARRIGEYEEIRTRKEDGFVDAMLNTDAAAVPFDERQPLVFGDAKRWEELTRTRRAALQRESERGMSPAEAAIWEKLKQPVLVDFNARPLAEVVRTLSDMTGVLMYIDQAALQNEGLTPEIPVTLSLSSQISLRSALNLILNTQRLDFQVRNEVLMITSARNTASANVDRVYSVKDLVIPIPNFVTDYNSGMAGALRQAYETVSNGLVARTNSGLLGTANTQFASFDPKSPVLGQMNPNLPGMGGFGLSPANGMMGGGPMSMGGPGALGGGGSMADFQSLIMLIQQTIEPDSWLDAGGTSSIIQYPSNLSLVVSAPQTTHEKIADLLESLRRLQDLQITIEVKFITLNDNFFERIGVDFDLRIDDNVRRLPSDDQGPSTVVGLSTAATPGNPFPFTADFDITMTQDSFSNVRPAFGGFAEQAGLSLGFAILSDLEMFFFLNAAQGDQRTNVLQAPRVTMFDGQAASINDTVQRPFVTSLIPVVADFAVAQQPVIVVLNEGTVLNVQAVVSPDKRFVRLTLNPNFSQIEAVETFTFEGSRTTRRGTTRGGNNILNPNEAIVNETNDDETQIISGTTVQQPVLSQTTVSTTVSVPDGGTILLGGIKRMREGRLERGVPILSKIPYVNRLFKNTAIGRDTSTLMMTVTPRIIIQEEEEEKYGVRP
jgi:general secretion pathway protein D